MVAANQTNFKNPRRDRDFEKFAREIDENFPEESENFSWHAVGIVKKKDGTVLKFTMIGRRLFITCRQRLATKVTNQNGQVEFVPVIPDISNFDHYGRSPALKQLDR